MHDKFDGATPRWRTAAPAAAPADPRAEQLKGALQHLQGRDLDFCASLLAQLQKGRTLSPKQEPYVAVLVERAAAAKAKAAAPAPAPAFGTLQRIIEMFDAAAAAVKEQGKKKPPMIHVDLDGLSLLLVRAGASARQPGSVNIVEDEGRYGNRAWFGRVTRDGRYEPSRDAGLAAPHIAAMLEQMAKDPAAFAKEQSKIASACCFCGTKIEHPASLEVGYGPICAVNYGLPWRGESARRTARRAASMECEATM